MDPCKRFLTKKSVEDAFSQKASDPWQPMNTLFKKRNSSCNQKFPRLRPIWVGQENDGQKWIECMFFDLEPTYFILKALKKSVHRLPRI